MIDLAAIRARVLAITVGGAPLFLSVEDTPSAADAMENFTAPPPAGFVSVARERAAPNRLSGRHRQLVRSSVSVLWCLGAERADEKRNDPMEVARGAIIYSLSGWRAPGADTAFDFESYSLRYIAHGLMWGESLFAASWALTTV
jgi:hypothetical protein